MSSSLSSEVFRRIVEGHAATAPLMAPEKETGKPEAWGSSTRTRIHEYISKSKAQMTIEDVAEQFGLSVETASRYLSALSGQGRLQRVSVYRLPEGKA